MLAEQGVGPVQAIGLFAAYMLVFLLDELIVFVVAVVTLRATKVQERHGRALKLVAGSVLICLAVTMLLAPTALSTVLGTVLVFGAPSPSLPSPTRSPSAGAGPIRPFSRPDPQARPAARPAPR